MNRSWLNDELDADEIGFVPHVRNMPRSQKRAGKARPPVNPVQKEIASNLLNEIAEQNTEDEFQMTYKASRYEAIWLEETLTFFFQHKWFDDVLRMVKGGKEASVYLCTGNDTTGQDYLAAKVYRPRKFRNLKNDWLYREGRANIDSDGREIRNHGMRHAIAKRTEYGRELLHASWLAHEFKTLELLHQAGADVPRPFTTGSNAILMEYLGDEVMGAPTLNEVNLDSHEAKVLYERVIHNIDLMLAHNRIHGDLSAFNILYWEGDIRLIDFPQAIHPETNRSAYRIFERDVVRIGEYFQRQGVRMAQPARQLASALWEKHNHRFVPLVDPKAIGEDNDDERDIWESLKNQ